MTFIQKINPINKESEKKKFLFDPLYNPQFEYEEEITEEELSRYGDVDTTLFDIAKSVLDRVIAKYGSESKYIEEVEGPVMTKDQVMTAIDHYLSELGLQHTMTIQFSSQFIARTSVHENVIRLRLPIEHRENSLVATLNHELGTHYVKNLNDQMQPWHKKRSQFGLGEHLETEEGLAVLHYYLGMKEKYLWIQSLYYYAACRAESMSFSELFNDLAKYVDDKERRWKISLRLKRGIKDTSQPGVMTRDQVYLKGVIKVLHFLEKHDYNPIPLYVGKIDVQDLPKVKDQVITENLHLPLFLRPDQLDEYKKSIQKIKKSLFP